MRAGPWSLQFWESSAGGAGAPEGAGGPGSEPPRGAAGTIRRASMGSTVFLTRQSSRCGVGGAGRGASWLPAGIWQSRQAVLVVTTRGHFWHLEGGSRGRCLTSHSAQADPHEEELSVRVTAAAISACSARAPNLACANHACRAPQTFSQEASLVPTLVFWAPFTLSGLGARSSRLLFPHFGPLHLDRRS